MKTNDMTYLEKLEKELKRLDLNEGCISSAIICYQYESGEQLARTKRQVAKDRILVKENKRVINILEKIIKLENQLNKK